MVKDVHVRLEQADVGPYLHVPKKGKLHEIADVTYLLGVKIIEWVICVCDQRKLDTRWHECR